jgi:hypothetical protein
MANLSAFRTAEEEAAAVRTLDLNLYQMFFDLTSIVDPTPISPAAGLAFSVARRDWVGSLLSGASLIPFVGEIARFGKLVKIIKTLEESIDLASKSEKAADLLKPAMQRLAQILDMLPTNAGPEIGRLRQMVNDFLSKNGLAKIATELPDVSKQFKFQKFEQNGYRYEELSGRLGVPGKVKKHRSQYQQQKVAGGTGDDAGHRIANEFGAPGGPENLTPQNWIQNRGSGTYRDMEIEWGDKLRNGTGIEATVQDVFKPGQDRAFLRKVEWTETSPTGVVTKDSRTFVNTQSVASRLKRGVAPTVPPGTEADIVPFGRPRP